MSVKRPAILFLGATIIGIIIAYSMVPTFFKLLLIALAIFLYSKLYSDKRINSKVLMIIAIFFLLGFYRFKLEEKIFDNYDKYVLTNQKGTKEMVGIVDTIGKSTNSNYYILSNCVVNGEKVGSCRCYFNDKIDPHAKIGNSIKTNASLKALEAPSNDGEFNQKNYYRSDGINFISFAKDFEIINDKYDVVEQKIYDIKILIKTQIFKIFDEKDAGLFSAMITGDKSTINKLQKKLFSDNGIAHILAISGLHLSILGLAIFELLRRRFSINISAMVVSIFILFYGIFIDAGATSLRAITMLYIRFISLAVGRTYDSKNTLYIICFIFLMLRPYLLFNAGFQFSYVAIYALNEEVYITISSKRRVKVPAVVILTLFLFPVTIYHYFTYPLYSILLNLIVIPLMSFVLGFGLVGLLCSFIFLPLGRIIVYVVHIIFLIYDKLCYFIESLPAHILWLGKPNLYEVLYYYVALFLIIYAINDKISKKNVNKNSILLNYKFLRIPICMVLLILSVGIMAIRMRPDFRMTFLSIGQGDSILIDAFDKIITIDGGSSSNTSAGEYVMTPHIKSRAISDIDYAFITHADSDHTNALLYMLEEEDEVKFDNLVMPINAKNDDRFDKLKKAAGEKNVNIIYAKEGDEYLIKDGLKIIVLSPDEKSILDNPSKKKKDQLDINEMSLTFKLDYKGHTTLFTGDIGEKTIKRILSDEYAKNNIDVDVLKVPHHGSKNSFNEEFYEAVSPKYAIISYGNGNTYGHPHQVVVDALDNEGVKTLKTGESGQIDIYIENGKYTYKLFK